MAASKNIRPQSASHEISLRAPRRRFFIDDLLHAGALEQHDALAGLRVVIVQRLVAVGGGEALKNIAPGALRLGSGVLEDGRREVGFDQCAETGARRSPGLSLAASLLLVTGHRWP